MDNIYFKNASGNRTGWINGNDVKDSGGNRVGFINGNDIKDSGGNRIGFLNGNDFKDAYGNRVGFINGSDIKDANGNRAGYPEAGASAIEMCAAGLLLLNLEYDGGGRTSSYSSSTSSSSDGETSSFWTVIAVIGFVFVTFWHFLKAPFVQIISIKDGETSARKEWWGTCIRSSIYSSFFAGFFFYLLDHNLWDIITAIVCVFVTLFFGLLPIILVSIRRVHDIGKPWWWILIPLVNFVMCGFFRGKVEGNKYI